MKRKFLTSLFIASAILTLSMPVMAAPVSSNIISSSNVSTEITEEVQSNFDEVFSGVKLAYNTQGWVISVTTDGLDNADTLGKTYVDGRNITIIQPTNAGALSTIHEIGHFLDNQLGKTTENVCNMHSFCSEFQSIYETEKSIIQNGPTHETSNAQEYYAYIFEQLHQNPYTVMKDCPLSSAFVINDVKTLYQQYGLDPNLVDTEIAKNQSKAALSVADVSKTKRFMLDEGTGTWVQIPV